MYVDGDVKDLNLKKEHWFVLDDVAAKQVRFSWFFPSTIWDDDLPSLSSVNGFFGIQC